MEKKNHAVDKNHIKAPAVTAGGWGLASTAEHQMISLKAIN